jgi:hypothetical protein
VDAVVDAPEPGADPVRELLAQMGESDPRLRLLAQLVQARAAAESARAPQQAEQAEPELRLRRLQGAYLELRGQYLRVAAALGACPRCWGEDPRCRDCGGAGASGLLAPDHELLQ